MHCIDWVEPAPSSKFSIFPPAYEKNTHVRISIFAYTWTQIVNLFKQCIEEHLMTLNASPSYHCFMLDKYNKSFNSVHLFYFIFFSCGREGEKGFICDIFEGIFSFNGHAITIWRISYKYMRLVNLYRWLSDNLNHSFIHIEHIMCFCVWKRNIDKKFPW